MKKVLFLLFIAQLSLQTAYTQYGWHLQNSGTSNKLNAVCYTSSFNIRLWVAGNNGTILTTSNGGINWYTQNSGTAYNLNSVQFKDSLNGFIAGDHGTILRTTNGGMNWAGQSSGTTSDLYCITYNWYSYPDTVSTLWATGKSGTIIKTTNLGSNWFTQFSSTSQDLRCVYSYFVDCLWAVGSMGTILRTSDGGAFWNQINSGSTAQLNCVIQTSPEIYYYCGIAVGNGGTVLKSTDIGSSWFPINGQTNSNLNSVSGGYNYFTFAVGSQGTILKSSNRGYNWVSESGGTSNDLYSIYFLGSNTGWAVGDNGTIINTTTELYGVDHKKLDANTIREDWSNDGTFNYDFVNRHQGFEWPKGENKYARYISGLWICANIGSDTFVSYTDYSSSPYLPGYTDNNGIPHGSNDPQYRMYKLSYGVNDSNRTQWPNALLGNSDQGAPVYFDSSSNSWEPLDFGDQTMFYSYTDSYEFQHQVLQPLKADIKQLNFAFDEPEPMANTTYSQYTIINRNSLPWTNTYITFWSDDDLGDAADDATGCDTLLQFGYTYNGSNYDQIYGTAPPAVSLNLIKGPIVYTGISSDTASLCLGKRKITRTGYKQLGMSVFNSYLIGEDPHDYAQFYNIMRGFYVNGSSMINPVTGLPTKFKFSGNPELNTGWIQYNPDDQRILISVGPINMNPGDTQVIVIAQVIAHGTSNLNSITKLRHDAQIARENYNNCFENVPISVRKNAEIINRFSLSQNYPNPFNPKTIIKFQLPVNSNVRLVIYDVLGREITTLVNERLKPGSYEVEWDGSNYASGVYFYKLQTEVFSETKKMVLVK